MNKQYSAAQRLLNLNYFHLDVWRVGNAENGYICVCYQGLSIYDGMGYLGMYGRGGTFEEACEDYIMQISGKTLRSSPDDTLQIKEIRIL